MEKYKNKDGIRLSIGSMGEVGKIGSSMDLVQEVISEAIKKCDDYNFYDKTSMRFALDDVKKFLKTNFDITD